MLGEHLQPTRQRRDRDVRARDEREREDDHPQTLRRLTAAGEQAHRHEEPLEGEAEQDDEPERRKAVEDAAVEPEADRKCDRDRDRGGEREDRRVREHAGSEYRAARDRKRAQPVDEAALEVLGGGDGGPDPGEQHAGGDEAGDEVSSRFSRPLIAGSTAANCPARPRSCRTRSGSRDTSCPNTRRLPESSRSSVATARTKVVFPAPLGPSTAVT